MSNAASHPNLESERERERERDWLAGHWVSWSGTAYGILGTLARGGMAEIFLASPRSGPPCVIKRLRRGGSSDASVVGMFAHEAQVALRLDHPNIASHFGAGESAGRPFLVMEYLEGQTLAALVSAVKARGECLSPELCVHIVSRILRALDYVHDVVDEVGEPLEIVHRDVCPRNVVLGYDGFVKLIDFGIATSRLAQDRVDVGVVKGKPNYMSPEQATGRATDRRSDVFSVGVVLWELLTRERFAGSAAPAERRYRLPFARVPRIREVRREVDPTLDAIVARALQLDPNARYDTAGEMATALNDYLESVPDADGRPELSFLMQQAFATLRRDSRRRIAELVAAAPTMLERSGERPVLRQAISPSGPAPAPSRREAMPSSVDIDIDSWVDA